MSRLFPCPSVPLPQTPPRAPCAAMRRALSRLAVACALGLAGMGAWAQAVPPATVTLTGVVRDFRADGVNFEGPIRGQRNGLVNTTLTGTAPTLTATGQALLNESNFSTWYTKTTDQAPFSLQLARNASGGYTYTNNAFFPIDNRLLGNEGRSHNFHFTYQVSALVGYVQGAGQTITLRADDDAWLFLDRKLGIDLGGEHPAASKTVNLDTFFAGRASGNYTFDLYYAERHTGSAVFSLDTRGVMLSPAPLPVPEPAALAMWLGGLGGLCWVVRRRRAKADDAPQAQPSAGSALSPQPAGNGDARSEAEPAPAQCPR